MCIELTVPETVHRWIGIVYRGDQDNNVEGTRQNNLVTSGEGVLWHNDSADKGTEQGVATVYQKHRILLNASMKY